MSKGVTLRTPISLAAATGQVQLWPPVFTGDASSVSSPPFGTIAPSGFTFPPQGVQRPRFNHPLTAPSGLFVSACNTVPPLNTISPFTAAVGGNGFTLTANGANFVSGSMVQWNGLARVTTFLHSGQLTAAITAGDIASAGAALVTVFNPTPGGGTSIALPINVGGTKRRGQIISQ